MIFSLVAVETAEVNIPADREEIVPKEDLEVILPLVAVAATEVNLPASREEINPPEDLEGATAHHWEATSILWDLISSSKITTINHLPVFC